MEILIGPPGSGKTTLILERYRAALAARRAPLLLAPTATMGEHLRNQLAREGHVFRPSAITTLAKFIHQAAGECEVATTARLSLAVEECLPGIGLDAFAQVAELPGFRSSIVRAIEELQAAGCSAAQLSGLAGEDRHAAELARIYAAVEAHAQRRGWLLRNARLARAAERIRELGIGPAAEVYVAGFYSFTDGEVDVLEAISQHAHVTVALPEWSGSARCLERLRRSAQVTAVAATPSQRQYILVRPATPEQEANEIARRMLEEYSHGRPFREMAVIVRSELPFAPVMRAALSRFGIPARFYFGQRLADHDSVRFLSAAVEAMLCGWDHSALLAAARMDASPLGQAGFDWFEHRVQKHLPGRGLAEFRSLAGEACADLFDALERMDGWRAETLTAGRWAQRFHWVSRMCAQQVIADQVSETYVDIWRTHAAALKSWADAMDEAAGALGRDTELRVEGFWQAAKVALRETALRVNDHRRDVVHVMDAFEARQWKLPVVFLPNLLEKHFPKYHAQDSILSEAVRRRLQAASLEVRTAADRQRDEAFLFETALTRGVEKAVLSAPRINEKGGDTLTSFFLQKVATVTETPVSVRPLSEWPEPRGGRGIQDGALLAQLSDRTRSISVSSVDQFLQCPFKFFGWTVLKLRPAPRSPDDRFNIAEQGSVGHKVLELHGRDGVTVDAALEQALTEKLLELRIPHGYRVEAVRLELETYLRNYVQQTPIAGGVLSEAEKQFELILADGTMLRGRIDRVDRTPGGGFVVIDYKYSAKPKITSLIQGHVEGRNVQTGLYLHYMKSQGHPVTAMLYAGFRTDITVRGWGSEFEGYGSIDAEAQTIDEMMEKALSLTGAMLEKVRSGNTTPAPADDAPCRYCDFRYACRVEEVEAAVEAAR